MDLNAIIVMAAQIKHEGHKPPIVRENNRGHRYYKRDSTKEIIKKLDETGRLITTETNYEIKYTPTKK